MAFIWNPEHTDNEILEKARTLGIKLHVTAMRIARLGSLRHHADVYVTSTIPQASPRVLRGGYWYGGPRHLPSRSILALMTLRPTRTR